MVHDEQCYLPVAGGNMRALMGQSARVVLTYLLRELYHNVLIIKRATVGYLAVGGSCQDIEQ